MELEGLEAAAAAAAAEVERLETPEAIGTASRRRDCHFAGTASPSLLKNLLNREGGGGGAAECQSRRRLGTAEGAAALAAGRVRRHFPNILVAALNGNCTPRVPPLLVGRHTHAHLTLLPRRLPIYPSNCPSHIPSILSSHTSSIHSFKWPPIMLSSRYILQTGRDTVGQWDYRD